MSNYSGLTFEEAQKREKEMYCFSERVTPNDVYRKAYSDALQEVIIMLNREKDALKDSKFPHKNILIGLIEAIEAKVKFECNLYQDEAI